MTGDLVLDFSRVLANLNTADKAVRDAALKGIVLGAHHLHGEAGNLAPKDEGELRDSAAVLTDRDALEAAVVFEAQHAAAQHEGLDYVHVEGQAKYLEGPMHSEAEAIRDTIANAIQEAMR